VNNGDGGEEARRLTVFTEHRPYLFAIAYRMLGLAEDAEDVLQEAWLRFSGARVANLEQPRAYLATIVTRLALDELRSARRRREAYVGSWLPEPVLTSEALPEDLVERAESASFAFLLMLEQLNPVERAVLVLHDVFDFSHEEIARMTERSAAASRQTLRRARLKLGRPAPARPVTVDEREVNDFLASLAGGDVDRLMTMLAPDVVLVSDGGGLVRAINRPLVGSTTVARFLVAMADMEPEARAVTTTLNGQPAILAYLRGALDSAFIFDITAAGVTAIYVVRNPEKLRRLVSMEPA
jgi:RNA polymerase sigma-70 factor, ECF subfamily